MIKGLHISGGDYAFLTFCKYFQGMSVAQFLEDKENHISDFLEANPEYKDQSFTVKYIEFNCDIDTFNHLRDLFGDYDHRKSSDIIIGLNTIITK